MFIKLLYNICCIIGILSVLLKILSIKPIIRLALLIKIFLKSAFIFLLLDYYFLGLTYIIVYVGAIAILFLFVIMKTSYNQKAGKGLAPFILIPLIGFGKGFEKIQDSLKIQESLKKGTLWNYFIIDYSTIWLNFSDIQTYGFLLYLAYPFITILFGILLWCVLIGIIGITI